jgi:3' terminal RNA ribose 2'-O-methyltransferase Hen1
MLLTISTTHQPATDLGFLLGKHPDRVQSFAITGGQAHVFYPEATPERCTVAMLLDVDTIDLVRTMKVPGSSMMLRHYVNDRPYVASSFTSSAISNVFSSALNGRCTGRQELVDVPMPLTVQLSVIRATAGEEGLRRVFEPLGYQVEATRFLLDDHFPDWGESQYHTLQLTHSGLTIQALLSHLYVLLPVFDNERHFYVSDQDVEILLKKGEGWLATHPEKDWIVRRYFKRIGGLTRLALNHLVVQEEAVAGGEEQLEADESGEVVIPTKRVTLHQQRLMAVVEQLAASGAKTVLDLGCGEGQLLKLLLQKPQFEQILGMDVAYRELLKAKDKLHYDRMPPLQQQRLKLIQGSLIYRDARLSGFDAAALVEVIEHVDADRLPALERAVFAFAAPATVVVTTPNVEYNQTYGMDDSEMRHADHRFEWTRAEFQAWGQRVAETNHYTVTFSGIGEADETAGAPSQMAVFSKS